MSTMPCYPSYEERTFNLYRATSNPNVEYLRHPCGVILIRIGPDHECLSKEIRSISFDTSTKKGSFNRDKTKQTVVGKGKKGGLKLLPDTKLCMITCTDDTTYTIRSGIKATLIEANSRLSTDPQLLKTSRVYAGFLAVVIPPTMLNACRNTIPQQFDVISRIGTDLPFVSKLLPEKSVEVKADDQLRNDENTSKRQKVEVGLD